MEQNREWDKVAPLVEVMKKRYPPYFNIEGMEPALTQDITEIVTTLLAAQRQEFIEKVRGMKSGACSSGMCGHRNLALHTDAVNHGEYIGRDAALDALLETLTKEKREMKETIEEEPRSGDPRNYPDCITGKKPMCNLEWCKCHE